MLVALSPGRAAAQAAELRPLRFEIGTRVGIAAPLGSVEGTINGRSLSEDIAAAVPVTLSIGVRRREALFLGLAATYLPTTAPAPPGGPLGQPCAWEPCPFRGPVRAYRVNAEAQYQFLPGARVQPWIGLGAGAEWLFLSQSRYLAPFLALHGGGNYSVGPSFSIGPFVGASFGQFVHAYNAGAQPYTGSTFPSRPLPPRGREITDRTWHGWLEFGVRGVFAL